MFVALNDLLHIDSQNPPKGKFFLISEAHNDGSFLIHHFLSLYLKGGYKVCFLSLVQSFTHYSSVAQKLGVSLNHAIHNEKLVFIEGLKHAVEGMAVKGGETLNTTERNPFHNLSNPSFTLKHLHKKIQQEVSNLGVQGPHLLLIDDLSVLLSLGLSVTHIHNFVQYCQVEMCTPEKDGCLVILVHTDEDLGDSKEEMLKKHLTYKCNVELHIKGLSSGYCREVHGQLDIIDHDIAKTRGYSSKKTVQYKITDKTVTLFAPGTSASVL